MIDKACMPVYIVIQIFLADGCTIQPEVVQEVLTDLKTHGTLALERPAALCA